MAVETDQWFIAELHTAAKSTAVPRVERLRALTGRLGKRIYDPQSQTFNAGFYAFKIIQDDVIEHSGGSGANGNKSQAEPGLVNRWLAFLDANEADLSAGRKYRVGDPELTTDLMPIGMHIYVDGKPWPALSE